MELADTWELVKISTVSWEMAVFFTDSWESSTPMQTVIYGLKR